MKTVDLRLARSFGLGGERRLHFSADVFNVFNWEQFAVQTGYGTYPWRVNADGTIPPKPDFNLPGAGATFGRAPASSMRSVRCSSACDSRSRIDDGDGHCARHHHVPGAADPSMISTMTSSSLIALALSASAATGPEQTRSKEQEQFWASLIALCGKAFEGQGIEAPTGNTTYVEKRLVMHVRRCEPDVVYIPFHVGEDRSRTWVITRTAQGLRLKHDHRHEDGTEDAVTQYRRPHDDSGLSDASGLPHRKSFRSPDDLVPRSRSREDVCLRSQKRGHGSPFSDGVRSLE